MTRFFPGLGILLALAGCATRPLSQIPLTGPYNPNNAFAKMIRGELQPVKVYETDRILAFMDHAPQTPGHVDVISKVSQARSLVDISPRDYAEVMEAVRKIAVAEVRALNLKGVTITENNGLGQSIGHLHVHIIPRYGRLRLRERPAKVKSNAELEAIAVKIRAALAEMDAHPDG